MFNVTHTVQYIGMGIREWEELYGNDIEMGISHKIWNGGMRMSKTIPGHFYFRQLLLLRCCILYVKVSTQLQLMYL